MLKVLRVLYTFHQHIIHIYLYGVLDKVLEDLVDHLLEGGSCVLESKGHYLITVNSLTFCEGYLIFIWWVHPDLIIAGVRVYEAKELVSYCNFY